MSRTLQAPPLTPEPDWIPLPSFPSDGRNRPFLSGGEDRIRLGLFQREDGTVTGRAWFGPGAQGPPGSAHGGSIASVLDEAMGACCWLAGHRVVAARLTTNYRKRLPLGTDARFEAWITSVEGRKISARSRITSSEGQLFAEAEGLFIELTSEQFQDIVDRVPAEWTGPGA